MEKLWYVAIILNLVFSAWSSQIIEQYECEEVSVVQVSVFLLLLFVTINFVSMYYVYLNMTKGESVDWYDFRREHLSFVDQKDELLYDSLTEEITGKTDELSIEEKQVFENIIRYLKLENIDENLDKGKLSGGERKKINLARFMYEVEMQNREVVILDEPTNHIDVQTKNKLLEYLKKMTDRIVIVISHDNDVISCADEVIAF